MTDNPDHGSVLWDLLASAENGDDGPLAAYLGAAPGRAATADRRHVLLVRNQYGTVGDGRWHGFSTQPHTNPWPGIPSRQALALLRCDARGTRSWFELTLPSDVRIDGISAEGDAFRLHAGGKSFTATSDDIFRTIADCAFGPPGLSEAEIERGFAKLAGRIPLDIVGPAEPGALLGHALPLVLEDGVLGWFRFSPQRPASYLQTQEYGPSHSLFCDPSGRFGAALARAREVLPSIEAQVAEGASLVQAIHAGFGATDDPRLIWTGSQPDGTVRFSIDDGIESVVLANLELAADGALRLLEIEDANSQ